MPIKLISTKGSATRERDTRHFMHYASESSKNNSYRGNDSFVRNSVNNKPLVTNSAEELINEKARPKTALSLQTFLPKPLLSEHEEKNREEKVPSALSLALSSRWRRQNLFWSLLHLQRNTNAESEAALPHSTSFAQRLVELLSSSECKLSSVAGCWNLFSTPSIYLTSSEREYRLLKNSYKEESEEQDICLLYIIDSKESYKPCLARERNSSSNNNNSNNSNINTTTIAQITPCENGGTFCLMYNLYFALAHAGVCALPTFTLLDVCTLTWSDLLSCASLRLHLRLMHNAKARSLLHMTATEQRELVEIAVITTSSTSIRQNKSTLWNCRNKVRPMTGKETLERKEYNNHNCYNYFACNNIDAQLFHRLYVTLMLYIVYNVRFRYKKILQLSDKASALAFSEEQELLIAFEHPTQEDKWLCFLRESSSSSLFTLSVDELNHLDFCTVVTDSNVSSSSNSNVNTDTNTKQTSNPVHSCEKEANHDTKREITLLQMAGCLLQNTTPYIHHSTLAKTVLNWATVRLITCMQDAENALAELFALFAYKYGCTRASLWHLSRTQRACVYRCNSKFVRARLNRLCTEQLMHDTVRISVTNLNKYIRREFGLTESLLRSNAEREIQERKNEEENGIINNDNDKEDHEGIISSNEAQLKETVHYNEMPSFSVLPDHMLPVHELQEEEPSLIDGKALHESEEYVVSPTSPYTHQESLVSRWRQYIRDEDVTVFVNSTNCIELVTCIGVGGSGIVYRGFYGAKRLLVAVKIFVRIDGVSEEDYIRQSLTDVAFYVLFNQLDDYGICHTCRAHDFIISRTLPYGITVEDATTARLGHNDERVQLCYLITDLMEGTLGRFLTPNDDEYDAFYDVLCNSPLSECELFQFLYIQLVARCIFDWVILDVMLHGQLRGDNMGYQYIHPHKMLSVPFSPHPNDSNGINNKCDSDEQIKYWNCVYDGIIVQYNFVENEPVRYLHFPARETSNDDNKQEEGHETSATIHDKSTLMRFIYFVDLGQGLQPSVNALTKRHLIGETLVDSCLNEDGLGRYWPLNKLYCKYVEVVGNKWNKTSSSGVELWEEVYNWASEVQLDSERDIVQALKKLFDLYAAKYGMTHTPTREELCTNLVLTWSPSIVNALRESYVYRDC